MLTASPAFAASFNCWRRSVAPAPSGFRISVVTPCVSMFSAVASAAGDGVAVDVDEPGRDEQPRGIDLALRPLARKVADARDVAVLDADVRLVRAPAAAVDDRAAPEDDRVGGRLLGGRGRDGDGDRGRHRGGSPSGRGADHVRRFRRFNDWITWSGSKPCDTR